MLPTPPIAPEPPAPGAPAPRRFVFALVDRLSMIAFANALEPLRIANRLTGAALYDWRVVSEGGLPRTCSNGLRVHVDGPLEDLGPGETAIVCSGLDVEETTSKALIAWLRKGARRGATLGGVCTGAYALARAGLLEGRRCTIHWENQPGFIEAFDGVEVTNHLYEVDGDRMTCAGGGAAADLMLWVIAEEHGAELAALVADQMIHAPIRAQQEAQRHSLPARIGARHPKLIAIVETMERHIEQPISPAELARRAGLSVRQLERLFRRYLNRSPKRYHLELRLNRARSLLLQTDKSVLEVALACGFASPSHFSKCYRSFFDQTPYRERAAPGAGRRSRSAPKPHAAPPEAADWPPDLDAAPPAAETA